MTTEDVHGASLLYSSSSRQFDEVTDNISKESTDSGIAGGPPQTAIGSGKKGGDKKGKKESIAVNGTPSHSYGVSLAVWQVTQCYLPPDTSEHTPPSPQPDLPTI